MQMLALLPHLISGWASERSEILLLQQLTYKDIIVFNIAVANAGPVAIRSLLFHEVSRIISKTSLRMYNGMHQGNCF